MCLVASGCVEAYYEIGMHVWDLAAASLIVSEAGGVLMDVDGKGLGGWATLAVTPSISRLSSVCLQEARLTSCPEEWSPPTTEPSPRGSARRFRPTRRPETTQQRGAQQRGAQRREDDRRWAPLTRDEPGVKHPADSREDESQTSAHAHLNASFPRGEGTVFFISRVHRTDASLL